MEQSSPPTANGVPPPPPPPQDKKPRRSRIACAPCSRDKAKCEDTRPCARCVKKGREDQCIDRDAVFPPIVRKRKSVDSEDGKSSDDAGKRSKISDDLISVDSSVSSETSAGTRASSDAFKQMFSMVLKPLFQSFALSASPFFIKEFMIERTNLWRWFLTRMRAILPKMDAMAIREIMMQTAISVSMDPESLRQIADSLENLTWFDISAVLQSKTENFDFPKEVTSLVEEVLGLSRIANTDLAIIYMREQVTEDGKLRMIRSYNQNVTSLFGQTSESIEMLVEQDGTPKAPFVLRYMTPRSIFKIFSYVTAKSLQISWPWFADTVEIIRPDNSIVECFFLSVFHLDIHGTEKENSHVFVIKPPSLTFDPVEFCQATKERAGDRQIRQRTM
jgi:hypothetical protein